MQPSIHCLREDITKVQVDAIVNAANSGLRGGGGVDGAIHQAGGPKIMQECDLIRQREGGCPTGKAVITTAGKLTAKFIIHTVGPKWRDGHSQEVDLLKSCYFNCLELAESKLMTSVAFPNISTGVYGFPKQLAAEIAINTVLSYPCRSVIRILFVCFDEENHKIYLSIMDKIERKA